MNTFKKSPVTFPPFISAENRVALGSIFKAEHQTGLKESDRGAA